MFIRHTYVCTALTHKSRESIVPVLFYFALAFSNPDFEVDLTVDGLIQYIKYDLFRELNTYYVFIGSID